MSQSEIHYLCDDKLVLYKRPNSRTDFWYARFKNEKTGKWKKFSTKLENLEDAKAEAQAEYRALQKLIDNDISIDTKSFSLVADYVIEELEADLKAGTGKPTYKSYIRVIKQYKEFFGKKHIGNISYQDLVDFDQQRTRRLGRKAKKSTINVGNTALLRVFRTAVERGWMHQSQIVTLRNDGLKGERRPYFELHEYQKLYRFMRKYVRLTTKDEKKGGVTQQSLMIRELLRDYVLFLTNTGMRHGTETKNLLWKHITERVINGEKYIVINLQSGKTGKRTIVCRHSVRRYLERIKNRFPHLNGLSWNEMDKIEEPVFRCSDGSVPKDWHGAFEILLTKAKLLKDVNGAKRSLYSLRHTYATFQILYSKIDLHTLAKNMGTSIAMLERHYSHLEVLHRADVLAGRGDSRPKAKPKFQAETRIFELQDRSIDELEDDASTVLERDVKSP